MNATVRSKLKINNENIQQTIHGARYYTYNSHAENGCIMSRRRREVRSSSLEEKRPLVGPMTEEILTEAVAKDSYEGFVFQSNYL